VGALQGNTTGYYNTANGNQTLFSNTTGSDNTANGYQALYSNTSGNSNTATGTQALYSNTSGYSNAANGDGALYSNTTGHDNVAAGYQALALNTTGYLNMANGQQALYSNTTGYQNTANGDQALFSNITGFNNTAYGFNALGQSTGSGNVAVGQAAGFNLTSGDDNIYIGNQGIMGVPESDTIRIGDAQTATYIAGIFGQSVMSAGSTGTTVYIDSAGKLGTVLSSRRFKDGIKPMDHASEAILELKPVTFHYKSDKQNTPCFGLIAEDVAVVNPDLVVRDKNGEILSVRYEQINAMLLNEFLKEHKKVEEQQTTIVGLESTIARQGKEFQSAIAQLSARLKEQDTKIQAVSTELARSRSTIAIAGNDPR
jgi:hypothetical protein